MSIEYHDLGLVTSALEREAPKQCGALRRLAAAFVATSLGALMAPGCVATTAGPPGGTWGLDNGTVGQALDAPVQTAPDLKAVKESEAA